MTEILAAFGSVAPAGFAALGFVLGMRHATDPDHVIAITAILTRERRLSAASRTGLLWGLGHSLTVLLVGGAIIILKLRVPIRLGLAMEFGVGLVLIGLGLPAAGAVLRSLGAHVGLWEPGRDANGAIEVHAHVHHHGDAAHWHPHVHESGADSAHFSHTFGQFQEVPGGRSMLKSFGVGLVHGLAGSAAIALFVLGAIPQPLWAAVYLAVFCLGTIAGMVLITTAIGAPMVLAAQRVARLHRGLAVGSGLLSLCFGLFLAYQIGIAHGLFSAAPIWTPR